MPRLNKNTSSKALAQKEIFQRLKEKLSLHNQLDTDERLASLLQALIEAGAIAIGDDLSVSEFAKQLGMSRNTVSNAFQKLKNDGILATQTAKPYRVVSRESPLPKKRGNSISINRWARANNIRIHTKIVSLREIIFQDEIEKRPDEVAFFENVRERMKLSTNERIFEIRRIRSFQADENEYRNGISEVSFINPEICDDFMSYFQKEENSQKGFFDYYEKRLGLQLIRSEFETKASFLSRHHYGSWFFGQPEITSEQVNDLKSRADLKNFFVPLNESSKGIEYYIKPFLRITATTYHSYGPLEYSHSYLDPDVISLSIGMLDLAYMPETPLKKTNQITKP